MKPLAQALGADVCSHHAKFAALKERCWILGRMVELASCRFYGSAWNQMLPVIDEAELARQIGPGMYDVLQFMWGEFATPSLMALFRRKAKKVVGAFHCSQRRQWRVTRRPRWYLGYDHIVLMSESQRDYFVDNGYPEDCLSVILHGVDTTYFSYGDGAPKEKTTVELLLIGNTERDHAFAASVLKLLGDKVLCRVLTGVHYRHFYEGLKNVEWMPRVADKDLAELYRRTDLLLMPMLDCTANNSILEAMSCGTPVMVNCVGGISEYVDPKCNIVMVGKKADEWSDRIRALATESRVLQALRPQVRVWAEGFDWRVIARQYDKLFRAITDVRD